MGYESRLYVTKRSSWQPDHVETVAVFNCQKMGDYNGWIELFDKPMDLKVYGIELDLNGEDVELIQDMYGDQLAYAELPDVINWLKKRIADAKFPTDNQRLRPLLGLLEGIKPEEWPGDIFYVVHFGY